MAGPTNSHRSRVEGTARRAAEAARIDAENAALPLVRAARERDQLARANPNTFAEDPLTLALRAVPVRPGIGSEADHLAVVYAALAAKARRRVVAG